MITKRTRMQLVAFGLLTLLGVSYTTANYLGLGEAFFGRGYVVTVDLPSSGGIFAGAEVTYRGVTVGRVADLRLSHTGVLVDLRLDPGTRVPQDTDAVVENRSAVGEQYVDLQPRTDAGPYLASGATIPRNRTAVPIPTEKLLLDIDRLSNSVPRQDMVTVVDELGKAFASGGRDLQRLIDSGDQLTIAATNALPQTEKLIDDSKIVLGTQRDTGPAIQSFAKNLADVSDTLRTSDPDIRLVLDRGVVASQQLDALLKDNRASLATLLTNLVTVGQVTVLRVHGIEQILVTYPDVVTGGFTVVPGDSTAHFGLVLTNQPPSCTKGYEGTRRTDPNQTSGLPPLNTGVRCAEPRGSATSVRGAQNAPAPSGAAAASSVPLFLDGRTWSPSLVANQAAGLPTVVVGASPGPMTQAQTLAWLLQGGDVG